MTPETAQIAAIKLLGWIVGTDDLCGLFLVATGASPDDLKARAGDPEFLASLIEFVMMDDEWILRAAEACNWPPEQFAEIRAALPGGDLPHWT